MENSLTCVFGQEVLPGACHIHANIKHAMVKVMRVEQEGRSRRAPLASRVRCVAVYQLASTVLTAAGRSSLPRGRRQIAPALMTCSAIGSEILPRCHSSPLVVAAQGTAAAGASSSSADPLLHIVACCRLRHHHLLRGRPTVTTAAAAAERRVS